MNRSDTPLRIKAFIRAPRAKVYAAWTRPELIQLWFAPCAMTVAHASAEVVVGGQYRIQMKDADSEETYTAFGVYREIVPEQRLVFTWAWEDKEPPDSLVTVEFHDKDDGTEMTLTHERLIKPEHVNSHAEGWRGCLDNLEARIGGM